MVNHQTPSKNTKKDKKTLATATPSHPFVAVLRQRTGKHKFNHIKNKKCNHTDTDWIDELEMLDTCFED